MGGFHRPLRALVVDDEAAFASVLRHALTTRGFECGVAHSVATALDAVDNHSFDVVVSDLELGATSGLLLLAEVRSLCPDATLILMTGMVDATSPRLVEQGLVDAYITKPFELDQLCELIQRARTRSSGVRRAVTAGFAPETIRSGTKR